MGSSLALPLPLPLEVEDVTVGALNTYAATAHAFDAPAVLAVARGLAGQAGTLLTVVLRQAREAELTGQLRAARTPERSSIRHLVW